MKVEISKKHSMQNKNSTNNTQPSFGGPLDGALTQALITIDTNSMVNAALVDVFAMVIPRTYIDTKERNKYAGAETLFRELTGTFIACLSAGYIAKGIANLYNQFVEPETKINPKSWLINDSLNLLKHSWDKSGNNVEKYVSNVFFNASGIENKKTFAWQDINWKNIEWADSPKWDNINWKNTAYKNIQNNLKSEKQIITTLSKIIEDKNIHADDAKQILGIIEHRITNAFKIDNSVNIKLDEKTLNSSLKNIIRDVYDMGKDVFTNNSINIDSAFKKLQKMNKVKTLGALAIASTLGLTNQYINRIITKKRTGTSAFVGEINYNKIKDEKQETSFKSQKEKNNGAKLLGLKLLASAGIIALAAGVMKIKSPKDFVKKLEFSGPITSGNAIKTVYTSLLVGRFLASQNQTELRESTTRDYLGFMNWLVLGGFASKGVAQLLDKKQDSLFNVNKSGAGLKHWLNDISLKSHAEIASKGTEFAKKNVWKLNLAHAAGLLYSTLALGFLIPLLNIAVTKSQHKKNSSKIADKN